MSATVLRWNLSSDPLSVLPLQLVFTCFVFGFASNYQLATCNRQQATCNLHFTAAATCSCPLGSVWARDPFPFNLALDWNLSAIINRYSEYIPFASWALAWKSSFSRGNFGHGQIHKSPMEPSVGISQKALHWPLGNRSVARSRLSVELGSWSLEFVALERQTASMAYT